MSEKTKKDKTPVEDANPDLSADTSIVTAAPMPTAMAVIDVPAEAEEEVGYAIIVATAKNALVTQLDALYARLIRPEDQADIRKLATVSTPSSRGMEEMEERWTMPEVKVAQGLTRDKPDNARLGDLFTTAGDVIKGSLRVTPLYMFEHNQMFPEGGRGPGCFAPDAKLGTLYGACRVCPHLPMGKNTTGQDTICKNGIEVVVLTSDMRLYKIEFFKTSKKAGTQFKNYARQSPNIWDRWYTISTQETKNDKGVFHILKTTATGEDVPTHIREAADALNAMISAERKAALKDHYESVARGGQQASSIDENVNFAKPGNQNPGPKPDFSKNV
jgi:hypothetical protein